VTDDRFWQIVERSRRGAAADPDAQGPQLVAILADEPVDEIIAFDTVFQERVRDAYRWDLWAVAYVMTGGSCSDDGFDYFVGWLIGKGRRRYEAALIDPERAADRVSPDEDPFENEWLWIAASNAYAQKTGRDDYGAVAKGVDRSLIGEPFDEDTVFAAHPKLTKRFAS
jgi:hypothetical protein